ncbi:hypothetical protein FF098_009795 [Parvularcula flava]|uniref:Uncharacterized protein n=1 Tax=Aquisalinus luteolus TaxID=1566827 RepID=A0A8J3ER85_9PROT|nr:hypothetical protein [Aquisalinus luteolus]NHK28195.1 hypothetical protein [Aquisalinus luteolus]GGH97750.1 hypothetical protein GCM10011355_19720 [Aquisalinus luteolus]
MSDSGDRQEKRISKLQILVTDTELADIDDWRFENRAANRSAAVRALIVLGMEMCKKHADEAKSIMNDMDDV